MEPESAMREPHRSVLYNEIIHALSPKSPGRYIDATVGAGGHAWGILAGSHPAGELLGLDLDPQALALARQRLAEYAGRFTLVQASYTTLLAQMRQIGWDSVQGIVLDLGVSSMQLDTPERGFSFLKDGPLDMRFGPSQFTTAADLVNQRTEQELADLIWEFGEDRNSRKIARAIVQGRPFATTLQLAKAIEKVVGRTKERLNPATRTFQALRIAVNQELQGIAEALPPAVEALAPGGRLAVIAFHSLEDRLVKHFLKDEQRAGRLRILTKKPLVASDAEIATNPRAASAKLRAAEKT